MTESESRRVREYLTRVRKGLRGLPSADVEDTVEEMRTHIFEEIGEGATAEHVLAGFGDAAGVASDIVAQRLRPEDGPPVPTASIGVRYSAWATDVVVGFGPLVLVPTLISFPFVAVGLFGDGRIAPIWLLLVSAVLTHWVMSPAEAAQMSSLNAAIPAWQWMMLALLVGWAVFYWLILRRRNSTSVGMWMTQLRGVRVNDERVVVRSRDISQQPLPLGAGRNRWWILLGMIPTGCLCILLALYYVTMGVGAFVQPWDAWAQPFEERADFDREFELVMDFTDALTNHDAEAAEALVDGVDAAVLDRLLASGSERGFGFQTHAADGRFVISEHVSEQQRRDIYLTVEKIESVDGHDYTESFRIVEIRVSPELVPAEARPAE